MMRAMLTNTQYTSNQNWHYESPPLYNEYIPIKILLKKKKTQKDRDKEMNRNGVKFLELQET
jgi:hypothetical protein